MPRPGVVTLGDEREPRSNPQNEREEVRELAHEAQRERLPRSSSRRLGPYSACRRPASLREPVLRVLRLVRTSGVGRLTMFMVPGNRSANAHCYGRIVRLFENSLVCHGCVCIAFLVAATAGSSWRWARHCGGSRRGAAELEVFVREGCPHCAEAKVFLEELRRERPGLQVVIRDIQKDRGALERLRELVAKSPGRTAGVPAFYLRGELVIGFSGADTTGAQIRQLLDRAARCIRPAGTAGRRQLPHRGPRALRDAGAAGGRLRRAAVDRHAHRHRPGGPAALHHRHRAARRLQPVLDVGAGPHGVDARGGGRPAAHDRHRRDLRPDPGHRLLRLHGGVAEPVPGDRDLARIRNRARHHRAGRGAHPRQGLLRVRARHHALDPRGRQARHLPAHARA